MREYKNLVATLYLKNGKAVKSIDNLEELEDTKNLIKLYNDSGIDKILIYDLSTEDEEHELNIHTIKELNRLLEIPLCAGGNINRLEDVKKLIYAGCKEVILNGQKDVATAQKIIAQCKKQIDELTNKLNELELENSKNKEEIKRIKQCIAYMKNACKDMNIFTSAYETGKEAENKDGSK